MQFNNLLALFDNWNMYEKAINEATNATGTLQKQQDTYMESTSAHLQKLEATWEKFYNTLIDENEIKTGIDSLRTVVDLIEKLTASFGGGLTRSILGFGAILSGIFGKQISNGIVNLITNFNEAQQNADLLATKIQTIQAGQLKSGGGNYQSQAALENNQIQLQYAEQILNVHKGISNEQYNEMVEIQTKIGNLHEEAALIEGEAISAAKRNGLNQEQIDLLRQSVANYDELNLKIADQIEEMRVNSQTLQSQIEPEQEKLRILQEQIDKYEIIANKIRTNKTQISDIASAELETNKILQQQTDLTQTERAALENILKPIIMQHDYSQSQVQIQELLADIIQAQIKPEQDKAVIMQEQLQEKQKQLVTDEQLINKEKQLANAADQYHAAMQKAFSVRIQKQGFQNQLDEMIQSARTANNIGVSIQKITTATSSLAMSWMSVSSILKTVNDDTLTAGQKLEQFLISFSMLAGTAVGNWNKFKDLFGIIQLEQQVTLMQEKEQILTQGILNGQKKVANTLIQSQNSAQIQNYMLEKASLQLSAEQIANETERVALATIEAELQQRSISYHLLSTEAKKEMVGLIYQQYLIENQVTTQKKLQLDLEKKQNALKMANAITIGVTAALAALLITYAVVQRVLDNIAKQAKARADAAKKVAEASKKESDVVLETSKNIQTLIEKYRELSQQYKNNEISSTQLKDQLYDLCKQYELEDLALKTLMSDYKDLEALYSEVSREANQKSLESLGNTLRDQYEAMRLTSGEINAESGKNVFRDIVSLDFRNVGDQFEANFGADLLSVNKLAVDKLVTQNENINKILTFLQGVPILNAVFGDTGKTFLDSAFLSQFTFGSGPLSLLVGGINGLFRSSQREKGSKVNDFVQQIGTLSGADLGNYSYDEETGIINGTIDFTKDLNQLSKNKDKIQSLLADWASDADIYGSEIYQNLKKWLDKNDDLIDAWAEEQKQARLFELEKDFSNLEQQEGQLDYKELSRYYEEYSRKNSNQYGLDQETLQNEFSEFISSRLKGNSELLKEYQKMIIYRENILDEEELEALSELSDREIAYLYNNLETFKTIYKGELTRFFDENKNFIETNSNYELAFNIKSVLSGAGKDGFKEEDISAMFNNSEIQNVLGVGEEVFGNLDYSQQITSLVEVYIKANQDIARSSAETIEELTRQRETAQQALVDRQEELNWDKIQEEFDNTDFLQGLSEEQKALAGTNEQLKQQLLLYSELTEVTGDDTDAIVELGRENVEVIKSVLDHHQGLKSLTREYRNAKKEVELYKNNVNKVDAELKKLQSTSALTAEDIEQMASATKSAMDDINSSLDNIQSAYKTLNSIIEDYNEDGLMTLDTVQSLIQLDPQYLACLEWEGNQMRLNEGAVQALTLAKIEEAKQTLALQTYIQLLTIAKESDTLATQFGITYNETYATTLGDVGIAAAEAAVEVSKLAAAIDEVGNAHMRQRMNEVMGNYEKGIKALDNVGNQVRAGGISMAGALGGVSKGGGGGGGGGSERTPKDDKKWEDEFDKWWEYKAAIELVEKELDRFAKKREKMFGTQLAKSLENENKLLKEQAFRLKLYHDALVEDTAKLREEAAKASYQFRFDEKGYIMNYVEETSRQVSLMNAAIAALNAGGSEEEYKEAEERYEAFKKFLSMYEEQIKKIDELDDQLEDIRKKELANNLQAWEIEIQVKLDLKQAKRDFNSWLKDLEEDFKSVYKDLGKNTEFYFKQMDTYQGGEGTVATRLKAIQDVIAEIHKFENGQTSEMFESMSQAQEKLKELRDALMSDIKDVHDLWKSAWDDYLSAIDDAKNKFEDLNKAFEHYNNELSFYGDMIELLFGEKAYDKLDALYRGQRDAMKVQLDSLKQQADMWEELWTKSGATMKNMDQWTEDQKKYYENMIEAQESLNDAALEYAKILQNIVLNNINKVADATKKYLYNNENPDFVRRQFSDQLEWDEMVKDDTERIYEIQSYENKIDSLIQKNEGNVKNQEKLNKLKEDELKNLREKKDLTDHDIKMAELRLQLAEKQMALDDAQNAKDTMKLTRNEQGNWSYQYVANEEDVASKEQEVLEAYQQLYEEAKNNLEELEQGYYDFVDEFYTRMAELEQARAQGLINDEEYQQQRAYLEEWFAQRGEYYATQLHNAKLELATANTLLLKELMDQDVANYEEMTDEQKALVDSFSQTGIDDWFALEEAIKDNTDNIGTYATDCMDSILPYWDNAATQMADKWNADDGESIKAQVSNALDEMEDKYEEYKDEVDWLSDEIGVDFDNIEEHIQDTVDDVVDLKDETAKYAEDSKKQINELKDVVDDLEKLFNDLKEAAIEALKAIEEELVKVGEAAEAAQQAIYMSKMVADDLVGGFDGGDASGGGGGGGSRIYQTGDTSGKQDHFYALVRYNKNNESERQVAGAAESEEAVKVWAGNANVKYKDSPYYYKVERMNNVSANGEDLREKYSTYFNRAVISKPQNYDSNAIKKTQDNNTTVKNTGTIKSNYAQGYNSIPGFNLGGLSSTNVSSKDQQEEEEKRKKKENDWKMFKGATGGYTGEWGSEGRLAILHEKELVLNKDDTSNILSAVETMRQLNSSISGSIMSQVLRSMSGLRNYSTISTEHTTIPTATNNTNQTYNIDKLEFPNVKDINTMVEALESLPLLASQYVNRSRR